MQICWDLLCFFCAFAYLEFKFTYQDIIRIVKRYKSVQARNNGIKFAKNLIQNIFGLWMPTVLSPKKPIFENVTFDSPN